MVNHCEMSYIFPERAENHEKYRAKKTLETPYFINKEFKAQMLSDLLRVTQLDSCRLKIRI